MPKLYELTQHGFESAVLLCAKQAGLPVDNAFLQDAIKKLIGQVLVNGGRLMVVEGSPFANAFEGTREVHTAPMQVVVAAPAAASVPIAPAAAPPVAPMITPGKPLPPLPPTIPPHVVPREAPVYPGPFPAAPVVSHPTPGSVSIPTTQSE